MSKYYDQIELTATLDTQPIGGRARFVRIMQGTGVLRFDCNAGTIQKYFRPGDGFEMDGILSVQEVSGVTFLIAVSDSPIPSDNTSVTVVSSGEVTGSVARGASIASVKPVIVTEAPLASFVETINLTPLGGNIAVQNYITVDTGLTNLNRRVKILFGLSETADGNVSLVMNTIPFTDFLRPGEKREIDIMTPAALTHTYLQYNFNGTAGRLDYLATVY